MTALAILCCRSLRLLLTAAAFSLGCLYLLGLTPEEEDFPLRSKKLNITGWLASPLLTPRVAIVVIATNDYLSRYDRVCRPGHERYVKRHGYTLKVLSEPLTNISAGPSMYKYLTSSQPWASDFDYLVVIDTDVCIMSWAPPIHPVLQGLGNGIGMVNEYAQPTGRFEDRVAVQRGQGWEDSPKKYYAAHAGLELDNHIMLQGGFMVFQPAKHSGITFDIFMRYAYNSSFAASMHYEQAITGYELYTRKLWSCMPAVWDALWCIQAYLPHNTVRLKQFMARNYFVHFPGQINNDDVKAAIKAEYEAADTTYRDNSAFAFGCEWQD